MSIKKLGIVVCGVLLSCLPQIGFAQSLQEKLNRVQIARTEFIGQMRGFQLYDKYIGKDPISNIRNQALAALTAMLSAKMASNIFAESFNGREVLTSFQA